MGLLSMCTETTISAQSPKPRLPDSRAAAGTWPVTARVNRDVASRAQRGRGAASASLTLFACVLCSGAARPGAASTICCSAEPHFHLSSAASPQRAGCSMQCSRERPGAGTPSVGLLQRPRYVMLPRLWPP